MLTNDSTHDAQCPVCDCRDISQFLEIPQSPVCSGMLFQTHAQAIGTARGNVHLSFCKGCGHIFNSAFDPELIEHTQKYDNSLHFSPRFQTYAESLASRLIERYDLRNKDIVEIGCGKGDFLMLLCKLGNNRGVGFDPTFDENRLENFDKNQITFIKDYYTEDHARYQADLIFCRHVLEHIQHPQDFIRRLHDIVGDKRQSVIFFEVPNVMSALRDLSIWDIFYEHCAYYSLSSLEHLFRSCQFEVSHLNEEYEGQFISIEAYPGEGIPSPTLNVDREVENIAHHVDLFSEKYQSSKTAWQQEIDTLAQKERKIVLWGAGAKTITFLNTIQAHDKIDYVVDINPHKRGKYIPGSGQEVVHPEFLTDYKPDVVIIMNPNYKDEVRRFVYNMKLTTELRSIDHTLV